MDRKNDYDCDEAKAEDDYARLSISRDLSTYKTMAEDSEVIECLAPSIIHTKLNSYEKPSLPAYTNMNCINNSLPDHPKKPAKDFAIKDNKVTAISKECE